MIYLSVCAAHCNAIVVQANESETNRTVTRPKPVSQVSLSTCVCECVWVGHKAYITLLPDISKGIRVENKRRLKIENEKKNIKLFKSIFQIAQSVL